MQLPDLIDQIKTQPRLFIRFHASWCGIVQIVGASRQHLEGPLPTLR